MEILQQFGVQPVLLAAQVVNFLILLFILKKFMYKPLLKVLDQRKKTIEDSLKNAEEIEKKLRDTNEKMDQAMADAAKDVQKVLAEASKRAAELIREGEIRAEEIQEKTLATMKVELDREKEQLERSVREGVAELVFIIVQKVSGKILTNKDRKKIAEESIKTLKQ